MSNYKFETLQLHAGQDLDSATRSRTRVEYLREAAARHSSGPANRDRARSSRRRIWIDPPTPNEMLIPLQHKLCWIGFSIVNRQRHMPQNTRQTTPQPSQL